jgi:hypothetical protein
MTEQVKIDTEVINRLMTAQLKHVHAMTDDEGINHSTWSDDGYDYLKGALALGRDLLEISYDADVNKLGNMLDTQHPEFIPLNYACDGVCEEVWKLIPDNWPELVPDRLESPREQVRELGLWKGHPDPDDHD